METTPPQLQTGVWKKQVWLVTGHNDDEDDIRMGGSRMLGPYKWVCEEHVESFVAEMHRLYDNHPRVRYITVEGRAFKPCEHVPTLEEELHSFQTFLSKPETWLSCE